MDSTKNRQELGVCDEAPASDLIPDEFVEQSSGKSAESDSSSEPVNPTWKHDQRVSFDHLTPGLVMIKGVLEKAVEAHKSELSRLQHRLSQFSK